MLHIFGHYIWSKMEGSVADSNGVNSAFFSILQLSKLMQQEVME